MIDDQKFFAWLDGELNADDSAAVEREVKGDPRLSARAEQHRTMQAQLKGAFDPLADAPVPERLRDALRPPNAEVVDFGAAQRARKWQSLPQWSALAAMLVVGILVGTMVQQRGSSPVTVQNGRLYASSGLKHALDTELASAPSNGAVRIGLTFRDQSGTICRSFTDRQSSGLACHTDGRWEVRGLFAGPEGQERDYRMAAGMDPNLAALVDSTMAGEPFDAAEERTSREEGWK